MLAAWIMELIFLIAPQYNVPPYLVAAIIIVESRGDPHAINYENANGTIDRGIMQLNSSWFNDTNWHCAETNIRAGCQHLAYLYRQTRDRSPTWWSAVVAYNCGLTRFNDTTRKLPDSSLDYAYLVFEIWNSLTPNLFRQNGVRQ